MNEPLQYSNDYLIRKMRDMADLIVDLYACTNNYEDWCAGCPVGGVSERCDFERRMRELGIEVDD